MCSKQKNKVKLQKTDLNERKTSNLPVRVKNNSDKNTEVKKILHEQSENFNKEER